MIIIGSVSYIRAKRFLSKAIKTNGRVVEMVGKGMADGGGVMLSPKIEFAAITGQTVQFTESWSSNGPDYKVGDEVVILYDPDNPSKAKVGDKKWKLFFIAWLIGGMGFLFLFILIFMGIIFLVIDKLPAN
jgi:hypothetical protein